MKTPVSLLTIFLFVACSGSKPPADNGKAANIRAKNEETALANEVSAVTRLAQKLENQGRGLEIYRNSKKPEALRECETISAGIAKEIGELDARVSKLADRYRTPLASVIADLNECVACSKTAANACVKARASINRAIKEIYP